MTKKLLFVTTILLALACVALAADVTGKWSYEQPAMGNRPARQVTITLKQDGNKLTGSVPGMRGGNDTEITGGTVDGDKVSFEVKREFNGNTMVTKYTGTVSGDEMKLHMVTETPNGNREGDVVAKKSTT